MIIFTREEIKHIEAAVRERATQLWVNAQARDITEADRTIATHYSELYKNFAERLAAAYRSGAKRIAIK